jgi:hypothetical protein
VEGAEADRGSAGVDVGPVVVVVGGVEGAGVLAAVAVGVADQRGLPLCEVLAYDEIHAP